MLTKGKNDKGFYSFIILLKHLLYQVSTKSTVETIFVDLQRFVRFGLIRLSNSSKTFLGLY